MKISTTTTLVLALSAAVSAQSNFKAAVSTLTNYGNYARQGLTTGFKTVPAKTNLTAGNTVSVGANVSAGGVDTIVSWNKWTGDVITLDVSEQGAATVAANERPFVGGSTASASARNIVPGRHSLLLQIGGKAGARAILEFWGGGITGDNVGVEYAFDIGNDKTTDFAFNGNGADSRIVPIRIPANGVLSIAIHSACKVSVPTGKSARYKTGASLRFSPAPHCAVQSYGASCGPRLSGRFSQNTRDNIFTLSYTGANPKAPSLLVLGTARLRVRIPGSDCALLNNARWVFPFVADTNGRMVWAAKLPTTLNLNLYMQAADLSNRKIKASNGVHALCLK